MQEDNASADLWQPPDLAKRSGRVWPKSHLVVRQTQVDRPRYPVIDVHNHLGKWLSEADEFIGEPMPQLADLCDRLGIETVVNLDGRWGAELAENLARFDHVAPERVRTFCQLDWSALGRLSERDAVAYLQSQLADCARLGARGVKVWKDLGLRIRDTSGELVLPDDRRVIAVLQTAGELNLPVLIHTADPVAFFAPLEPSNERWAELEEMPSWWFGGPEYPTFQRLIAGLHALVAACPMTMFIGAHVGGHAEDLGAVGRALAANPNFVVDTGGRLGEIGRQPRAFRRLVSAFPDRVLFGTDCFPLDEQMCRLWWRFLETDDEHFDYVPADWLPPSQGDWRISGCALPAGLLEAVYRGNAQRVLGL